MYKQLGLLLFPFLLSADKPAVETTPESSPAVATIRVAVQTATPRKMTPASGWHSRHLAEDSTHAESVGLRQTPPPVGANGFDLPLVVSANASLVGVGDFNNDGTPDLLMYQASVLQVMVNSHGMLNWGPSTSWSGVYGGSVVGDFNRDGKLDFAISESSSGLLEVWLGNGDATFRPPFRVYGVGAVTAVADFNGDGKPDLATLNGILPGNGDGTFGALIAYPTASYYVNAVAVGDLNGDGKPDIAYADTTRSRVGVLLGNGDGTFRLSQQATLLSPPSYIAIADVNSDGKAEIIATMPQGGLVCTLFGYGDGTFQLEEDYEYRDFAPRKFVVADINGDGSPDLVIGSGAGALGIMLGSRNGRFKDAFTYDNLGATSVGPVADFNGDGIPDLLALGTGISLLLGGNIPGQLRFATQPVSTTTGIMPQIVVEVRDSAGNILTGAGFYVTLTSSPPGINVSEYIYNGVATFNDLVAGIPGVYSFTATAEGVSGAISNSFNITGNPLKLVFTKPPVANGTTVGPVTVQLEDSNSIPITSFNGGEIDISSNPSEYMAFSKAVNGALTIPAINFRGTGSYTLTASTSGVAPVTSNLFTIIAATTTTLNPSANPLTFGQNLTLTATVTPATATGTVTFYDGAATLGSSPLNGGIATLSVSTLGIGWHSLTAIYAGDATDLSSGSLAFYETVNAPPTSTAISSSANPSTFGQSLTITATVSPLSATGTVTFKDGAMTLGAGTLSNGSASLAIATLPAGSHSLTAVYGGDANNSGSTSPILNETITQAATTVTLSSSASSSTFGQTLTFTATVSPGAATGTVTFRDGGTIISTVPLNNGTAALQFSNLTAGSHTIVAAYNGDANDAGSTSAILTQTVSQAASAMTLSSSINPSTFGQSVTLLATISPAAASGFVVFKDGPAILGSGAIYSGTAYLTLSTLTVSPHALTAVYNGDSNDVGSTSAVYTQTVNPTVTSTTLTSSPNPSTVGQSVSLTATVSIPAATGSVTFKDGAATIGTGPLNGGSAYLTLSTLAAGPHSLTAVYGGDTNDLGSTSAMLTQTVVATGYMIGGRITLSGTGLSGVNVTLGGSQNNTTTTDGSGNYAFSGLTAAGNYTITPSRSGYAFNPPSASFNGLTGSQTANFSVAPGATNGKIGIVRSSVSGNSATFSSLVDSNGNNAYDASVDRFIGSIFVTGNPGFPGLPSDIPVAGDWLGTGHASVGIYRPTTGQWFLDTNNNGIIDPGDTMPFNYGGIAGDKPVVGDWNGIGKTCVGIFRQGFLWILDQNCNNSFDAADYVFPFGGLGFGTTSADMPVTGSWTGNGKTRVGFVRACVPPVCATVTYPFLWVLDNADVDAGAAAANHQPASGAFAFGGVPGDVYVTGDWLGTGITRAGIYRQGNWLLDLTGAHTYDTFYQFGGVPTDVPIVGVW
jgi:hypothetical protein